jgi:hypothetical protein
MTSSPNAGSSLPEDPFLDRLGLEGRIPVGVAAPEDSRRLREGFAGRLAAARRRRRRTAWLGATALLLLTGSVALAPRSMSPPSATPADAQDDLLLRQVRACREAPDIAGLRSTFVGAKSISAPDDAAEPGPVSAAREGRTKS